MSKLLRAGLARLIKCRIFWICMAVSFGIGLLSSITRYREMMDLPDYSYYMEDILFSNCIFMPLFSAVFAGLFIGTEYSDGTIRNKLIAGHTRSAVYFSNIIVCTLGLLLIHLTNIAAIVCIGFPLVQTVKASIPGLVLLGLISLTAVVALSAIFSLMSMLIHNKAVSCVAALILSFIFLVSAMTIQSRLSAPEYYPSVTASYTDESGEMRIANTESVKNPNYLTGTKRKIYEFLYDFLPGCQMLQITEQSPKNPGALPAYALSITAAATACGIFFFRRKNIN